MIELTQLLKSPTAISGSVSLVIEQRVKCRLKVTLDDGREAGIFLPRGSQLQGGDLLANEQGDVIQVIAANESVSIINSEDALQLTRAAYHLGNRHVPVQINEGSIRYQHDHVLDEMLTQMGFTVSVSMAPFEPERGAYHQHNHDAHHHSHVG